MRAAWRALYQSSHSVLSHTSHPEASLTDNKFYSSIPTKAMDYTPFFLLFRRYETIFGLFIQLFDFSQSKSVTNCIINGSVSHECVATRTAL